MANTPHEGADMNSNTAVRINWATVNFPTILAIAGMGVGAIYGYADLQNRLAKVEEYRVSRSAVTDRKFDDVQEALEPLVNLPYRVGALEQQQLATNLRIDRMTEILTNTMELIRKDVATLSTKVEVLSSKIDTITPTKRASITGMP
jgi:hypothetical protein